jgi:hypothetical protein
LMELGNLGATGGRSSGVPNGLIPASWTLYVTFR